MPLKLTPLEQPIAARLRQWRRWAGWSQHAIAASLGCKRDLLAAYETGRAAAPWGLVQRLALAHRLNPEWLYSGEGEPEGSFDLHHALSSEFPAKMRFSEAWRQIREQPGNRLAERSLAAAVTRLEHAGTELQRVVSGIASLPLEQQPAPAHLTHHGAALARALALTKIAVTQLERLTPKKAKPNRRPPETSRRPPAPPPSAAMAKASRTDMSSYGDIDADRWERLLRRIRAATARRGAKSELARQLGVHRQNVTAWLQGAKRPNAVSTLRLSQLFPEPEP